MSLNRVVLVGRLTKDPELRYSQAGKAVARFTLAVGRTFTNAQGEKETDFIQCVVFGKTAENTANFLTKGSMAGVDGRIQTGSYEKEGARIYTTEVVADSVQFLEPKSTSQERIGSSTQGQTGQTNTNTRQSNDAPYSTHNDAGQYRGPNSEYVAPNQQNYTRVDEDPFSERSGPIEVSDDDLPF